MTDKNLEKNVKNENLEKEDVGICIPEEGKDQDAPFTPKNVAQSGTFKEYKGPKREDTATDVYYKTECKLPDSKVAVPTEDSVDEAKEWVDDANKM